MGRKNTQFSAMSHRISETVQDMTKVNLLYDGLI